MASASVDVTLRTTRVVVKYEMQVSGSNQAARFQVRKGCTQYVLEWMQADIEYVVYSLDPDFADYTVKRIVLDDGEPVEPLTEPHLRKLFCDVIKERPEVDKAIQLHCFRSEFGEVAW